MNFFGFHDHSKERKRRKKHSSSSSSSRKTSQPTPVAHHPYPSHPAVHMTHHPPPPQASAISIPHRPSTTNLQYTQSLSPPRHPIYGANPQLRPQHAHSYSAPPAQYHANHSAISFAPSPPKPPRNKEGILHSYVHRVDNPAAKSHSNLCDQLASDAGRSTAKLATKTSQYFEQSALGKKSTQVLNQGAALCDIMCSKLDAVLTSIDGEKFSGNEQDLEIQGDPITYAAQASLSPDKYRGHAPQVVQGLDEHGTNQFSKVWLYANSRLPPHMPPFKVYMPTYPLICLAATYSDRVYTPPAPKSAEMDAHVPSDWRSGTKAMVLKSVPVDDMHTIVFAIRGSATFMDWAVNYRSAPSSPEGFLDDPGNMCHAGFLYVARKMIKPVADRLRLLLQENPSRSNCSLLITGHSAGGAVAALLYAHMMSSNVSSDLNYLTGFFKRVHCVTFGAPPISLLPLQRSKEKRHKKSLFYSFINEGDPVPRADKQVVRSLLKLYASPAPSSVCNTIASFSKINISSANLVNPSNTTFQTASSKPSKFSKSSSKTSNSKDSKMSAGTTATTSTVHWEIPPTTLSAAGRLVVLRKRPAGRGEEDVEAVTVDDELLRTVVYGDPMKHMMSLYKKRVERLAVRAVTVGEL